MRFSQSLYLIVILGLGLLVTACVPERPPVSPIPTPEVQGTELPFETVVKDEHSTYLGESSRVLLATDSASLQPILDLMQGPQEKERIAQVDLTTHAVIALFRGPQASGSYEVEIQYVVKQANTLYIYARFWEPGYGWGTTSAVTSSYHIVQVPWTDGGNEPIQLILKSYGQFH